MTHNNALRQTLIEQLDSNFQYSSTVSQPMSNVRVETGVLRHGVKRVVSDVHGRESNVKLFPEGECD